MDLVISAEPRACSGKYSLTNFLLFSFNLFSLADLLGKLRSLTPSSAHISNCSAIPPYLGPCHAYAPPTLPAKSAESANIMPASHFPFHPRVSVQVASTKAFYKRRGTKNYDYSHGKLRDVVHIVDNERKKLL